VSFKLEITKINKVLFGINAIDGQTKHSQSEIAWTRRNHSDLALKLCKARHLAYGSSPVSSSVVVGDLR
jgi:hypothetical protein